MSDTDGYERCDVCGEKFDYLEDADAELTDAGGVCGACAVGPQTRQRRIETLGRWSADAREGQ
jgi:hypothetical protein